MIDGYIEVPEIKTMGCVGCVSFYGVFGNVTFYNVQIQFMPPC